MSTRLIQHSHFLHLILKKFKISSSRALENLVFMQKQTNQVERERERDQDWSKVYRIKSRISRWSSLLYQGKREGCLAAGSFCFGLLSSLFFIYISLDALLPLLLDHLRVCCRQRYHIMWCTKSMRMMMLDDEHEEEKKEEIFASLHNTLYVCCRKRRRWDEMMRKLVMNGMSRMVSTLIHHPSLTAITYITFQVHTERDF